MKKVLLSIAGLVYGGMLLVGQENSDSLQFVHLQEVQVVSSRASDKSPLSYSNLKKEDIQGLNFAQDIPSLLTLTPSVVATSDAGTGIGYSSFRIRGTDANRINVTANGIPMNDSESHSVFWVNIPDFASSIQDLQVQRGLGTSANGAGAFGASINMKTENSANNPHAEFSSSYGSFDTRKATLKLGTGLLNNHWAFDSRLSSISSQGYIDRASADLKSYFLQASYFNNNMIIKGIVFGGQEETYHAWDGVPKDSLKTNRRYNPSGYMGSDANGKPQYYDKQTDNFVQTNYHLSILQVLSPSIQINASLHYTRGDGYYEEYKRDRKLEEYGLKPFFNQDELIEKSDMVRQKVIANDFFGTIFSLNYKTNALDIIGGGGANKYIGDHYGRLAWVKSYLGELSPHHEFYRSKGTKIDANMYLRANYALSKQWNAYADVQYRYIDYQIVGENDSWDWMAQAMQKLDVDERFKFFNPKAGLFYRINPHHDIFFSLGMGHREPNRNAYTDAQINEKPAAESLQDYELGYTYKDKYFKLGLNIYYMKYKNQLVLTGKINEIGEMLSSNIPNSHRLGLEVSAAAKLPFFITWNTSLTVSENKIQKYSEHVDMYDAQWTWLGQQENYIGDTKLSFSPSIIANNALVFSRKHWNVGFYSNFVGRQYIDNTSSKERSLDAYCVSKLSIAREFALSSKSSIAISLLLNNIFNRQYESNAWVYSYYLQDKGNSNQTIRGADFGYFPQAGFNTLMQVQIKY
ncbi:TonB-dependent receptor [Bacteroidales bacterium]|nr:TonB-dependent receptor [Bacteroidales bacterium]